MEYTTKKATKAQIQKVYVLLRQLGIAGQKEGLALSFSNGRTSHVSDMYLMEAKAFIEYLARHEPSERLKSVILSLGYRSGLLYGDTPEDKKMNMAKLDKFLLDRGTVKKRLNAMTYEELRKTHRQFEAMLRSTQESKARKATKSLLDELGIEVLKRN